MDLNDAYFPEWIDAVKAVEAMDFDILVPGHGPLGTKADATEHRRYLQALYDAVLDASRNGQSLDEMKKSITLAQFNKMDMYDKWRELNIEGMYRQVNLHRRGN
jgi:glyoxylase-like metal-dependent hydrolase (beta-lactamase superfamily II)